MISLISPVRTRAHGWPAGAKLAGLCAASFALFLVQSLPVHLAVLAGVLTLYALPGGSFFAAGMRGLRVLWPFLAVLALWHGLDGSPVTGAVNALRLVSAVGLANLVTMTTRLSDLIAVIRWLLAPLRRFGVETRPLELAVALVIRTTPMLLDKARALIAAWRARSPRRPGWQIVLPFTLVVLDDADHLSDALRARGGLLPTEDREWNGMS